MIEGQSHINIKRAAGFTVISVILIVIAIVILWKVGPIRIGAIIDLLAVPFLVAAMYYDGIFWNKDRKGKQ